MKGLICTLKILHCIALPAVINLAGLSLFQHFRGTKTPYNFMNALGKIIYAETLLDEHMFVACIERLHL